MTTTDTDALQERIARALYENAEYYGPAPTQPPWDWRDDEERGEWMEIAAAVLPIIAAEVKAAKAEAWRAYAAALEAVPDYAPTEYDKGRVDQRHATIEELYVHATEYETGDSDDHR